MANQFYVPSEGTESWKNLLVEPQKQWKTGYSARTLAHSWEQQDGFPPELIPALTNAGLALEVILGIPEYKVCLDTSKAPSQNDLFVLCKDTDGLVVLMVEGKVSESFDKEVWEWNNNTPSRLNRLHFLMQKLELNCPLNDLDTLRYQLLHRTASAILVAEKLFAKKAIMLVHSFSENNEWFADYKKFLTALNYSHVGNLNEIVLCKTLSSGIDLYVGWVKGKPEFLKK